MTPEYFQQIEELYHAAREKSTEERAALLSQVDPELRRAVEAGKRSTRTAEGFVRRVG